MLPAAHRMRRSEDFARTIRGGVRSGGERVVVHLAPGVPSSGVEDRTREPSAPGSPALVGFVVSRAVGSAVVRTRVKRRLRHQVAARLDVLPAGHRVVVRALPAAAEAASAQLGADLDRCLAGALRRAARTGAGVTR